MHLSYQVVSTEDDASTKLDTVYMDSTKLAVSAQTVIMGTEQVTK